MQNRYPRWLHIPGLLGALFLIVPLLTIVIRTPWGNFFDLITTQSSLDALWLSLKTCLVALLVCLVLGIPLAFALSTFPDTSWARLIRTIVTLPMMLPPVVAGLALLLTWGRKGLIGEHLDVLGIQIGFSTLAVVMAQVFVAMPFLVSSLEGSIRSHGIKYDAAAKALGASRARTFFQVTLPVMLPAILSASALALSRALGEFGATITFAGSLQGTTQTMPLAIYLQRQSSTEEALALAVVLIGMAITVLFAASFIASKMPGGKLEATPESIARLKAKRNKLAKEDQSIPEFVPTTPTTCPTIHVDAAVADREVELKLDIPGGKMTSVMGPNGSGKSTLLNLIVGTLKPSSGSITFNPPNPKIVLLQQTPLLFPHMTVQQNVEFGLHAHGYSKEDATKRANQELAAVGLTKLSTRRPNQLSGGQAQRAAIARAMALTPDIVLLDEPMAGLDEASAQRVRDDLKRRMKASPFTGILVTHDPEDARQLADFEVLIRLGKVHQALPKQSVPASSKEN